MAVAATGFALLAGFGGGAYAGVLPGPIQDRVSDIARNVGLSLPAARNEPHRGGIDKTLDGAKDSRPEPAQRAAETGAEHNRGESGQSSSDQGAQENRREPEQSGSDQTSQTDSQESTQDKSDGPAQTSDAGQGTQSNGSEPTQDERSAGGDQTGNDPEGQATTGIEGG